MHLAHGVVAGGILFELHAPAIQFFDGLETMLRVRIDGGLIDDAVVRHGDFLHVLLGRRVAGNDGVVQAVHAHRNGAAAFDVRFIDKQHAQGGIALLRLDGGHRAVSAAADHDDVVFEFVCLHAREDVTPQRAGLHRLSGVSCYDKLGPDCMSRCEGGESIVSALLLRAPNNDAKTPTRNRYASGTGMCRHENRGTRSPRAVHRRRA